MHSYMHVCLCIATAIAMHVWSGHFHVAISCLLSTA